MSHLRLESPLRKVHCGQDQSDDEFVTIEHFGNSI